MSLTTVATTILLAAACNGVLYADSDAAGAPGADAVILEINGAKLTAADLEKKQAAALFQAQTNYYEAQRRVIEGMIDDHLLEQQAQKEGLTVSQLLERHVDAAIAKAPSEETLRVYYEGVDTAEPFEAVRDKIVDSLRQRRIAKAKAVYVQSLRSQASIVLRLPPPRAPLSMKNVPVRGVASPRVTLLEFADYECPYCQQIHPVLDRLETEFKGKLALAFKDYPLPMHADAPKAAEAAHCAGAQGKYWEYHDTLFKTKQLSITALKQHARDLKLDTAAFDTCLDKSQMAGVVNEQAAEAQAFGLPGTPAILINGRMLNGNLTYEKLHALIVEELNATGGSADAATRSQTHGAQ